MIDPTGRPYGPDNLVPADVQITSFRVPTHPVKKALHYAFIGVVLIIFGVLATVLPIILIWDMLSTLIGLLHAL